MKNRLAKLLDVKSLITLALVGALIFLVVTGQEIPDMFYQSLALVLAYYFTRKVVDEGGE